MSASGWITLGKVKKILGLDNKYDIRRLIRAGRLHPVSLYKGGITVYSEAEVRRLAAEGNLTPKRRQRNTLGQFTKPDQ